MSSDKLISHTLQIAGESYPVKLTKEEVAIAQEIEQEINSRIAEFKVKYMVNSSKDVLAMVLLTYAFESKHQSDKKLRDYIERIDFLNERFQSF